MESVCFVFSLVCRTFTRRKTNVVMMKRCIVSLLALLCVAQLWAVKVGVLLPFKDKGQWGQTSIEFYRGFLLAVDSLKHQGLSVEVYAVDSGTTEASLHAVLNRGELSGVDLLFGPAVEVQVNALATYCREMKVRLIVPFNTPCTQIADNPYVTELTPPRSVIYRNIVQLAISSVSNPNFVMLKCNETDEEDAAYHDYFARCAIASGYPCKVLNVGADDVTAQVALSTERTNIIVPDSHSENALKALLTFVRCHPQYKIALLGYPAWLAYANKYQKDLFECDTYIFSPFYYNALSGKVMKFDWAYNNDFHTVLRHDYPSMALFGFDAGYYFLSGVNPDPYQQEFRLVKVMSEGGGQVNNFVQLVHYGTNRVITLIK